MRRSWRQYGELPSFRGDITWTSAPLDLGVQRLHLVCWIPKHLTCLQLRERGSVGVRLLYLDTLAGDGKHHGELCPRTP